MKAMRPSPRIVLISLLVLIGLITLQTYGAVGETVRAADSAEIVTDTNWTMTVVAEREIAFAVPAGWTESTSELSWSDGEQVVGLTYDRVGPGWQAAYSLPAEAEIISEAEVEVDWADAATRFVVETPAGSQVYLIVIDDGHIYEFFAGGGDIASLSLLLDKMAASAVRADDSSQSVAIFGGMM